MWKGTFGHNIKHFRLRHGMQGINSFETKIPTTKVFKSELISYTYNIRIYLIHHLAIWEIEFVF